MSSVPTHCEVAAVSELQSDFNHLFALFTQNFAGVDRSRFEQDLVEKDSVVLLREQQSIRVVGFTTIMTRRIVVDRQPFLVFYSGDTVVAPDYWGSPDLLRAWIGHVFETAAQHPDCIPYWMLISASFRTYRFLPVFWQEFYPRYDRPTPEDVQQLIDRFAEEKYGAEYLPPAICDNPSRRSAVSTSVGGADVTTWDRSSYGIVRFEQPTPVRPEFARLEPGRRSDPHVDFCLTRVTPDNLTRAGRRIAGVGE